ncbi:hypothetical protein BGX29_004868 [Mortierella sp. GBA35]|nr:hypothetical protein BGX29_004868 [Mortierella sp. GBA35]
MEMCQVLGDFFGKVNGVALRPGALELAAACDDGSVRVWRPLVLPEGLSAQLVWSSGHAILAASDAITDDAVGLSKVNRQLLEQHGTTNDFSLSEQGASTDEEDTE